MKSVLAELITIGDEILYGQTLDTNAHWMSEALSAIGVRVIRRTTCGDNEQEILKVLSEAESRADIILITGGLGPTSDDLTKPCLAKYFDSEIKINPRAMAELEDYMASRNRPLNNLTRFQASLPETCEMVSNERGTAPGMWFNKSGKIFVAMPGVPNEMKHMMSNHVIPKIKGRFSLPVIYHRIVRVAGIGESWLAELIEPWEKTLPSNIKLAYLPTYSDLKLRITAFGIDKNSLKVQVDSLLASLLPYIKQYHYGYDDDALEVVIGKILRKHKHTLAIAESCTGGYIAHTITAIPGSSDYFTGSITPYQNEIKMKILGVQEATLVNFGAVSEQTATEMADKVRTLFGTDYGLASSGIAGPDGGTDEKPVGTVWIACSDRNGVITKKLQLTKDREVNIKMSAVAALNLLYQRLPKTN